MRKFRGFGLAILLLVAGAVAFYGALRYNLVPDRFNPLQPLDLTAAPGLLTDLKLRMIDGDTAACVAAFKRAGLVVKPLPRQTASPGCTREGTVLVTRLSQAGIGAEEMRCDMAVRLYLLERHVIQPLARKHFAANVTRISHFGSYSCRTMRGGSWRMSEHSTANAFDLSGFKLSNGRHITLKKDWTAHADAAGFLREVRLGACGLFNMVLSPDYNAAHADHFHVDLGLFRGCH